LYFVETRCRMDDVMVRMDLQLYRIDDQNYLVDFRNLGYRSIPKGHQSNNTSAGSSSAGASSESSPTPSQPGGFSEMANTADELRARKPELTATRKKGSEVAKGNEVSSPYLFLECAVRLIVELASPQGGDAA
jgi:carbon catabolite-derepressing protein kinase